MENIVITGAGGNLGKVVVKYFLDKGYQVIALTKDAAEATSLRDTLGYDPGVSLRTEAVDLADESAVQTFAAGVIREYETIDAALLLAGGFAMGGITETDTKALHAQLALNFETAYHLTRSLFSHMLESGSGRLVFVGTRPALQPADGKNMVAYSLSKSLLFRLAEILNAEAGNRDVVSSVVVPSTIDTPANRKSMPDASWEKWVKPQQIAELLHMICSGTGAPLRETVLKIYGES